LTTGRLLEHYNSGTMTRRTPNSKLVSEDILYVHPADAEKKGVRTGEFVTIISERGEATIKVEVNEAVKPGVIYTTFHFPEASINYLTSNIGDEFTMTPEYKVVAVDFKKSLFAGFRKAECDPGK